jgi:hypothetical protein
MTLYEAQKQLLVLFYQKKELSLSQFLRAAPHKYLINFLKKVQNHFISILL